MKDKELRAKEKEIDYQISIKNNLWNALVLSIAGTLGLFLTEFSYTKIFFIFVGLFFTAIFLKGYFKRCDYIECLIKDVNAEG